MTNTEAHVSEAELRNFFGKLDREVDSAVKAHKG